MIGECVELDERGALLPQIPLPHVAPRSRGESTSMLSGVTAKSTRLPLCVAPRSAVAKSTGRQHDAGFDEIPMRVDAVLVE